MRRISTVAFAVAASAALLRAGAARAADICSGDDTARAAAPLEGARAAVYALPAGEELSGDVTAAGRRAIETFKDRIGAFTAAAMRCQPENPSAHGVKTALAQFKNEAGDHTYGNGLSFDVRIPKSPSGLVAVAARFGIKCGEDAMLMIFERRGESWTEALTARGKPYKTIAAGWWSLAFAISKADARGHWFVAVTHVAPWCSSNWSMIDYSLLRPSGDPSRPATLLHREDEIFGGESDLKAGVDDFDLRFYSNSIDLGVFNRKWIRHYAVHGDVVRRIAPLAESPRDFADEWIVSAWKEAGEWSSLSNLARLRSAHDEVHKTRFMDYVSMRACSDAPGRFQIETEKGDTGGSYFFQVQGGDDYRMLDVTRRADRRCTLPDAVDPPMPQ